MLYLIGVTLLMTGIAKEFATPDALVAIGIVSILAMAVYRMLFNEFKE